MKPKRIYTPAQRAARSLAATEWNRQHKELHKDRVKRWRRKVREAGGK